MKVLGRAAAIALLISSAATFAYGEDTSCGDKALAAEAAGDRVRSWRDLHIWFTKYAACNDGSVSELLSDFVIATLVNRWSDLSSVVRHSDWYLFAAARARVTF